MSEKLQRYLDRVQKQDHILKMRQLYGLEHDPELSMYLEVANSGLSSADEYLERAYSLCVHASVAHQLNPPVRVVSIPPPPSDLPIIAVGDEVETGQPVWFLLNATCSGVTIVGMSGSGKSVAQARLLASVPDSVLLYGPDTKKEILRIIRKLKRKHLYIRPNNLPFNLLECPTNDPATYYSALLENLASILGIDSQTWPEASSILAKIRLSLDAHEPMISLNQAIKFFSDLAVKKGKVKFQTFSDRLALLSRTLGKNAHLRKGADITGRISALGLDFSGVSVQIRQAIETVFLYQLMQSRLRHGVAKALDVLVCYDESIETFSKSFNTVSGSGKIRFQEMFLNQGRSFNFGRIILAQYISQLSDSVLANSRILIILRLADPGEARIAVQYLGLTDDYIPVIQNLPDGHAFVKSPSCPTVQVKVKFLDLGQFPSDEDIALSMAAELKWVEDNSIYDEDPQEGCQVDDQTADVIAAFTRPVAPVQSAAVEPEQIAPTMLLADWAEFLNEILANPTFTSTQHGKHLTWGMYKTARVKKDLIDAGLIAFTKQKTSGRPSERLLVTRKGIVSLEALGTHDQK